MVYYRLYITYTLTGFLFNLDQSNVYKDIQKIESLIRKCLPIPPKLYKITNRLKSHSIKRIVIEHTICRIKKYRIMSDVFRNRLRRYDNVSDIVSGLTNYRIIDHM